MKKSLDSIPLLLFFITYFVYDFFIATQVFVGSTALILLQSYLQNPQPLKAYTSHLLVIGLGGLTLVTKNEVFLVWKPTVMYFATAISLLISQLYFQKSLLEKGVNKLDLHAPTYPWKKLDYTLVFLFSLLAIMNLQVFHYFGLDIWIKYKFYSLFALMIMMAPVIMHIESYANLKQDAV